MRFQFDANQAVTNLFAGQPRVETEIEGAAGTAAVRVINFSVEMETGTGKTYVYIRTALELY
jgi:type III restriction enzyme